MLFSWSGFKTAFHVKQLAGASFYYEKNNAHPNLKQLSLLFTEKMAKQYSSEANQKVEKSRINTLMT